MRTPNGRVELLRATVVGALLIGAAPLAGSYVTSSAPTETPESVPGRGAVIVLTIDATGPSQIVAYGPGGETLYENHTLGIYHDVDPSDAGDRTVTYVASELRVAAADCPASDCVRNVVERVNLTTGNVTRLYAVVAPQVGSSQVHDVDRVNETVLLVADIGPPDRVYMVNTTTGEEIWEWRVERAYEPSSGGQYPGDWTHLNDVELLPDGRVMVSLRNQDSVVFLDPGEGIQANMTLGADDAHEVLYEQHNPDYIPASRGGPAVVIADSENNRIVEYQRRDGKWVRTWTWRDARLQWPRDADRLPNGDTLLVDTHGNRLLAVTPDGRVVWTATVPDGGYDVEQLETGDESAGGHSAGALGYRDDRVTLSGNLPAVVAYYVTSLPPSLVLHGSLFVLPGWVSPFGAAVVVIEATVVVVWAVVEVLVAVRR